MVMFLKWLDDRFNGISVKKGCSSAHVLNDVLNGPGVVYLGDDVVGALWLYWKTRWRIVLRLLKIWSKVLSHSYEYTNQSEPRDINFFKFQLYYVEVVALKEAASRRDKHALIGTIAMPSRGRAVCYTAIP